MSYKHITIEYCINQYKDGWNAIIHNGKVIGFKKENGTPDIPPKRTDK